LRAANRIPKKKFKGNHNKGIAAGCKRKFQRRNDNLPSCLQLSDGNEVVVGQKWLPLGLSCTFRVNARQKLKKGDFRPENLNRAAGAENR